MIDQRIKAILQEGLAVYRVFADQLEAVRPEVIVTYRPGPRLVESLEILAEALHPGALLPRHGGSGWVAWPRGVAFL